MKMENTDVINWLLQGDVSIQYQTWRDLLNEKKPELKQKIPYEGWGAAYLSKQRPDGHWGLKFYQPKWTSTHYTLLDLRNLEFPAQFESVNRIIDIILDNEKGADGGINPSGTITNSDVCVNGMFLNYTSYFGAPQAKLVSVIDYLLEQQLPDGGFNCHFNRKGARHSSLHSTLSVLEGLFEYKKAGYNYRISEISSVIEQCKEFILMHQLFISDRTGKIIRDEFLKFTYPCRWRYDVFRALDFFQYSQTSWDNRMQPAIDILIQKKTGSNLWNLQAKHKGQEHFAMEHIGHPSRWNTLRAMRILKCYRK